MLLVRTEVRSSSIHGKGLFAVDRIREGAVVWIFDSKLDRLSVIASGHFSWRTEDGYVTPGDDAKYINHSATPNLSTTPGLTPVRAARDIEAGDPSLRQKQRLRLTRK